MMEAEMKSESPQVARSTLEGFRCSVIGVANGVIIQANGRDYVIQLQSDSEESFQEVLSGIEQAYGVHYVRTKSGGA